MFTLAYTVCVTGFMCFSDASPMAYESLDRCFQQGAILAGITKTQLDVPPSIRLYNKLVCEHEGQQWKVEW